jgi:type II secretory pathway pseudopilin PulG
VGRRREERDRRGYRAPLRLGAVEAVRLLRRLRSERGYSMVELIMVCALLSIVLASVTIIMVNGTRTQFDLNARFQAQSSARLALAEFRGDAHNACASLVNPAQTQVTFSVPVIDFTPNPDVQPTPTTQCGRTDAGANLKKVIWCVLTSPTNTTKYALYRSITSTCTATSKFEVDNMVTTLPGFTNWFSAQPTTIAYQNRPTVTIDIPVSLKSGVTGKPYDLKQAVTLRNGVWALSATSCSSAVPCTLGSCTLASPSFCYPPTIS